MISADIESIWFDDISADMKPVRPIQYVSADMIRGLKSESYQPICFVSADIITPAPDCFHFSQARNFFFLSLNIQIPIVLTFQCKHSEERWRCMNFLLQAALIYVNLGLILDFKYFNDLHFWDGLNSSPKWTWKGRIPSFGQFHSI